MEKINHDGIFTKRKIIKQHLKKFTIIEVPYKITNENNNKKCPECGAYLWSNYSPHNKGCSMSEIYDFKEDD